MSGHDRRNAEEANRIMRNNHFTYERRRTWIIWGSKHQPCSVCEAEAYEACRHLGELRKGNIQHNRMPHAPRIDWVRILMGLYRRQLK